MNLKKIELIKKLWKFKKNILANNSHKIASILVPLVEINNNIFVVLEKRAKNISQEDEICFPGGKFDENLDIDFSYTAIRETAEELGISFNEISIISDLNILYTPLNSIIYSYFGYLKIKNINKLNFNKLEVQKLILIPLDELILLDYKVFFVEQKNELFKQNSNILTFPTKELGLPKKYHKSWYNSPREIFVYYYQDEIIWGITALILKDFIEKYKKLNF
jgi:peroxisomal coenzyme A diphosphatase NUDT7